MDKFKVGDTVVVVREIPYLEDSFGMVGTIVPRKPIMDGDDNFFPVDFGGRMLYFTEEDLQICG